MYVYYAAANRNTSEVFAWQDLCMALDSKGIIKKETFQSKQGLKNKRLIIENPNHVSGLCRMHTEFVLGNMKSK